MCQICKRGLFAAEKMEAFSYTRRGAARVLIFDYRWYHTLLDR